MDGLIHEIEVRKSLRALSDKEIPEDVTRRIMTAATYAPSCFNNQPWRFLVVNDSQKLEGFQEALTGGNYWAKKAPMGVIVATRPDLDAQLNDRREYALLGCGLAMENLLLQSFKEGLIAHPMAGFDPLVIKENFNIPEDYIVIALVAVGYPGDSEHLSEKHREMESAGRVRKPEAEVISYNEWTFQDEKK